MINLFQFLKEGTSLSRHSHHSNQQLEQHIIHHEREKNHTYEQTGKFHDSDSEISPEVETYDEKVIEAEKKRREQKTL